MVKTVELVTVATTYVPVRSESPAAIAIPVSLAALYVASVTEADVQVPTVVLVFVKLHVILRSSSVVIPEMVIMSEFTNPCTAAHVIVAVLPESTIDVISAAAHSSTEPTMVMALPGFR